MPAIVPEQIASNSFEKRNLELKAAISNLRSAEVSAIDLGADFASVLHQIDTYFHCNNGRLKLREIYQEGEPNAAELIYYSRPDFGNERWSSYTIAPVSNSAEVKALLTVSNGLRGVVDKVRTLYLWNKCRIDLDNVIDLGSFLEFEVVSVGDISDDQHRMDRLIKAFNVQSESTIAGSYSDLVGI